MRNIRRLVFAGVTACVAASPAIAQLPGLGFGGSIGANLPNGRYADGAKTGLVANGLVELRSSGRFGLRGELFWSRSDIDAAVIRRIGNSVLSESDAQRADGDVNLIGGIANVVMSMGMSSIRPYLIGGVGVYHRRVAQNVSGTVQEFRDLRETDNDVGFNGGAGLRLSLGGLSTFVEARYHAVATKPDRTTFVPVTVGISF